MKTFKTLLATLAVLLCSISARAHDFEVDGIYYNITSSADLTVAVTYKGWEYNVYSDVYKGTVTIPSTVSYNKKTYSVTSIGERTFAKCSLKNIKIPKTVTSIGRVAFSNCSNLTSITIPKGVTTI